MTKTVSFPELINDRFAEIAGSVDPQTVLTLKGFTAPEINSICSAAGKLGFEVCVPEVAPLDVNSIENNARAFLVSLMTPGDKPMICLYEQYLSVCDTLNGGVKLTDRRFVIVDNSLFTSVSPALIPEETAKELAAYFDSENTADPEKLAVYTKYYVELDDGTLCITDYTGSSSSVRIPETIDGKTVTCIEQGVIGRCSIVVIELPKTLKFIPCFADNSYDTFWLDDKAILKAVKLNNPELLPEYLFYGCANLREVSLPDFDTTFGYGTFWDCERLRYIRLPQTLTEVVDGIFEGCTSLKKLIFPEGIKKFSAVAFNDIGDVFTPHLETIMLPDSLETITGLPFFCLSSLTELKIPDSVKKFDFAMEQCLCYNCNEKLKITFHDKTYGSIKYDDGSGLVSIENDPQMYDDVRDLVDCELPENWIKEQGPDGVEYL